MTQSTQDSDCTRKCWIGSAIAGVVLAILLKVFGDWTFIQSVFTGFLGFVILGFLLAKFMCTQAAAKTPLQAEQDGSKAEASNTSGAAVTSKAAPLSAADVTTASSMPKVQPSAARAGQSDVAGAKNSPGDAVAKPAAKKAAAKKPAAIGIAKL